MAITEIVYEGPAARVHQVAALLDDQGLEVTIAGRVIETKGQMVEHIVVPLLVGGAIELIKIAVVDVHKRWPEIKLRIKGEEPPER